MNSSAIVYLHGSPGSSEDFPKQLIPEGTRFFTYDRPGFGQSLPSLMPLSLKDHCLHLKNLLDEQGISRCALIGHSFGARLALEFALLFPHTVQSIAWIAPYLFARRREKDPSRLLTWIEKPVVGAAARFLLFRLLAKSIIQKNIKESFFPQLVNKDFMDKSVFDYSVPSTFKEILEEKVAFLSNLRSPEEFKHLAIPCFSIQGRRDLVCPPSEQIERLQKYWPHLTVKYAPHSGHLVRSFPEPLLKEAVNFINSQEEKSYAAAR